MRPHVVQRISDFKITEGLIAAGHGVALLPRYTVDTGNGTRLLRRPLTGIRAARHIEAVLRPGASARPAALALLACLHAEADHVTAG